MIGGEKYIWMVKVLGNLENSQNYQIINPTTLLPYNLHIKISIKVLKKEIL